MLTSRTFVQAALVALVWSEASAADQSIYQWKDTGGKVHYTDTPPPPGAQLLQGPKPKPAAKPDDTPTLKEIEAEFCSAKLTAEQCREVSMSIKRDMENARRETSTPEFQEYLRRERERNDALAKQGEEAKARQCEQEQRNLVHLKNRKANLSEFMRNDPSLHGTSQAELETRIAQAIAQTEQFLSEKCK